MKKRTVALIIFYDENKKILLQDRHTIKKWGEEWGFFGGGVENNETPEQALIRETKEELSFDLKEFKKIGVIEGNINPELFVSAHLFIAPINNNLCKFIQKEGTSMNLFTFDAAKKLKMAPNIDAKIIQCLEEYFKNENNTF